jgi:membrane-associated two-gene conflict system component 1 (EACC1)
MDLQLSVDDLHSADDSTLRSLLDWLGLESTLRGRIELAMPMPQPGQMGGVADVLLVALGGGGSVTALMTSLSAWFKQPRRSDVTVTVSLPDGRRIAVNAKRAAHPEDIVKEVLAAEEAK